MPFGLLIIGDEILSGKRTDKHFPALRDILAARGLALDWVLYLGDDRQRLAGALARSFAGDDVVFSCGGIGATPDDHTRQAAAQALGLPLELHPEAARLITERSQEVGLEATPGRLEMGEFPRGADLIPNPYNRIPGFSIRNHWFVPGFPDMAWPMLEWVLDTHYAPLFHRNPQAEKAVIVRGLAEATLTPLMQDVEHRWPGIKVFSLPRLNPHSHEYPQGRGKPVPPPEGNKKTRGGPAFSYEIELGVKGDPAHIPAAFAWLRDGVDKLGGQMQAIG